jgi:hypothetical protein
VRPRLRRDRNEAPPAWRAFWLSAIKDRSPVELADRLGTFPAAIRPDRRNDSSGVTTFTGTNLYVTGSASTTTF